MLRDWIPLPQQAAEERHFLGEVSFRPTPQMDLADRSSAAARGDVHWSPRLRRLRIPDQIRPYWLTARARCRRLLLASSALTALVATTTATSASTTAAAVASATLPVRRVAADLPHLQVAVAVQVA